jgi:hypothetical protein
VTIYRQASLPHLYFEDMTYTGVLATIFTGIEPAVALSLACVPFLRPLIYRNGNNNNISTGSDNSQYASRSGDSTTLRSKQHGDPLRGRRGKGGGGPSSKEQHHDDNDDSSEIQLRPLEGSGELRYEAEVSPGGRRGPTPPGSTEGAIMVRKGWDVVSGARPGS